MTLEKLKTLGVVKALKTSDNTPLAVMRTGQLRRNDGSLVQGVQTANITLRTDANYAINILGTVIQPGETKNIQIDLGAGVNTTVPIFPATNGATGQAISSLSFRKLNSDSRLRVPAVGPGNFGINTTTPNMTAGEEKSYFLNSDYKPAGNDLK